MQNQDKELSQALSALIKNEAVSATKYISDKIIVRTTRRAYKGKFAKDRLEILFTIGKPNFAEREFIKKLKKAGEPFPVKKIQLKFPNKKK